MKIGEISNISIDSSLLRSIDLDCIKSRCHKNICCYREDIKITTSDIQVIDILLPEILPLLSKEHAEWISHFGFEEIDEKMKTVSTLKDRDPICIFYKDGVCLLDKFNAAPLLCKAFPITIENNIIKLKSNIDIPCLNVESSTFLFNWNEMPGNDNGRLMKFLSRKFGIDWVKTAKIEKFDTNPHNWHDGQTIKLTNEKNFLLLRLEYDKPKIKIEIDDGRTRTYEVILNRDDGSLNIYIHNHNLFLHI